MTEEEIQAVHEYNRALEAGNGAVTLSATRASSTWAIIRFQRAHSWLTADGIAGENTWRAIDIRMDSLLPARVSF